MGGLTIVNWAQILSNPTGKFSDLENISALVKKDGILLADLESLRLEDLRNLFEMVENYIQNRIVSLDRLSKKHIDAKNDLKLELTKERNELTNNLELVSEEKSALVELCCKYLSELFHASVPSHTKMRLINEGESLLPSGVLDEIRAHNEDSKNISRFSASPVFSSPVSQSLLPYARTEGNLLITSTKLGDVWQIWDKHQTTGDTSRVVFSDYSVTAVLCDGAGSTAVAGMIFSRILATLIADKIPMSANSMHIFAGSPMRRVLGNSLVFKDDNLKAYSPIFRNISTQDASSLPNTIGTGMSTALNVIVHKDGLFWYSSVGDCHLYIIRHDEGQSPCLVPIYTTNNQSDNTELIGFQHHPNITRSSDDVGRTCHLNKGDILVLLSDHISSYATKAEHDFALLATKICVEKENYDVSMDNVDSLINEIVDKSETSDDISAIFFKFGIQKQEPPSEPIGWSHTENCYFVNGIRYGLFEKNYFYDGDSSGLKRINKYVASNLSLILDSYRTLPEFVPNFQIYQSQSGSAYYIVIEHLDQEEFIRLDRVIYNLTSIEEIEQIQYLLNTLNQSMTDSKLVHCDIAPTNIFLSKTLDRIRVVDLDTLYCTGCFPLDIETGHAGMFGKNMNGYVPSMYIHKFPLLVLDFTLEIIKSCQGEIKDFVEHHILKKRG